MVRGEYGVVGNRYGITRGRYGVAGGGYEVVKGGLVIERIAGESKNIHMVCTYMTIYEDNQSWVHEPFFVLHIVQANIFLYYG